MPLFKIQIDPESRDFKKGSRIALTGFALEIHAQVAAIPNQSIGWNSPVAIAAIVTGTMFFVIGVFYLARSKNRSPGWAVLGLLSLVGWIMVAFLEDRAVWDAEASPQPIVLE